MDCLVSGTACEYFCLVGSSMWQRNPTLAKARHVAAARLARRDLRPDRRRGPSRVPAGCTDLRLRDELGTMFTDAPFAVLFSSPGRSVEAPWQLALVTLPQVAENLADCRAADTARGRPRRDAPARDAPARDAPGPVPRAAARGRARPSAHRQHACPDGGARPQPPRRKIATRPAGHATTGWKPDHDLGCTAMRIRLYRLA